MESVYWYSKGLKKWQADTVDWLIVRLDQDPDIESLTLTEATHHFFEMLAVFDAEGTQLTAEPIEGPGPFHFSMDGLKGNILLFKARFLPYTRPPQAGGFEQIACGSAHWQDGRKYKIRTLIGGESAGREASAIPWHAADVVEQIVGLGGEPEEAAIELELGVGTIPFQLCNPLPANTRVYVLKNEEFPTNPEIRCGREVNWQDLPEGLVRVDIKTGKHAPSGVFPSIDWTSAVPIMEVTPQTGRVGLPLIRKPMISGLRILDGREVWVTWNWDGPRGWLNVRLSWDFYRNGSWKNERRTATVHYGQYGGKKGYRLMERDPKYAGYSLDLVAIPMFLDVDIEDQNLTAQMRF